MLVNMQRMHSDLQMAKILNVQDAKSVKKINIKIN